MKNGPITSQKEASEVKEWLAQQTADTHSVPIEEGRKRIDGLYQSGILDLPGAGPENPYTQAQIVAFLSIPSSTYAHLT